LKCHQSPLCKTASSGTSFYPFLLQNNQVGQSSIQPGTFNKKKGSFGFFRGASLAFCSASDKLHKLKKGGLLLLK